MYISITKIKEVPEDAQLYVDIECLICKKPMAFSNSNNGYCLSCKPMPRFEKMTLKEFEKVYA